MWVWHRDTLARAIQRDAHELTAVLMPDGATVLAPDEDLGFTVSLEDWLRAGGRALGCALVKQMKHYET